MGGKKWARRKMANPSLELKNNKIKITPNGTKCTLPVLGRVKVIMMARKDGEALGIIVIKPEGAAVWEEEVFRITPVVKEILKESGIISGGETQTQIDRQMQKMMTGYKKHRKC